MIEETAIRPPKNGRKIGIHTLKKPLTVSSIILCVVIVAIALYAQYRTTTLLSKQVANLTSGNEALKADKSSLIAKNMNLTKTITSLQDQLTATQNANTTDNSEIAVPHIAGKFVVTGVKDEPAADFSASGLTPLVGQVRAVSITITNLTTDIQQYTVGDFTATSDSGVVVDPRVYPGPEGQNVWNNSKLAPGGSQDIVLLFGTDKNLVTLNWKAAGGTDTISGVLPAPSI